jgi:hypothetical protein
VELQVRLEALRVAAKLAFAGAAFACGGKLAPEDAADEASVDAADEEAATTACVVTPDAAFDSKSAFCNPWGPPTPPAMA